MLPLLFIDHQAKEAHPAEVILHYTQPIALRIRIRIHTFLALCVGPV